MKGVLFDRFSNSDSRPHLCTMALRTRRGTRRGYDPRPVGGRAWKLRTWSRCQGQECTSSLDKGNHRTEFENKRREKGRVKERKSQIEKESTQSNAVCFLFWNTSRGASPRPFYDLD